MSNIKLVHSGGNSVSLTTPDSNPAANRTFKLPGADGTCWTTYYHGWIVVHSHLQTTSNGLADQHQLYFRMGCG